MKRQCLLVAVPVESDLGSHLNPFPRPQSKISTVHVDEDVLWLDLENLQR